MKTHILLLSLLFFSLKAFAQGTFVSEKPGFIGINTTTPTSFLTVEGLESASVSNDFRTFLKIHNKSNSNSSFTGFEIMSGSPSYKTVLQHVASTYLFPGLDEYADFGQLYSRGAGLILRSGSAEFPSGVIKFMTGLTSPGGSLERMRIDMNGNVGIGTKTPKTKIHVSQGDVYLDNSARGIILTSPDGNCWRVTVNNSGNLQNSQIVCPN